MSTRDYDGRDGSQAFQGDVCIFRVPAKIAANLNRADEIEPEQGRLILAAGEFSGHHHALRLPQPVMFRDDGLARELEASLAPAIGARFFRDPALAQALVKADILTRVDLCVGFLEIEGSPMMVTHEEHDGIRLPTGIFYVGRQVESAGAEERRVAD